MNFVQNYSAAIMPEIPKIRHFSSMQRMLNTHFCVLPRFPAGSNFALRFYHIYLMRLYIIILIAICGGCNVSAAELFTLSGVVTDSDTHEPLPFASVTITNPETSTAPVSMHTDANGRWIMRAQQGNVTISVTYIGYKPYTTTARFKRDRSLSIKLIPADHTLGEVVITAKESGGMTSASRIDRDAMEHIQPTSFTDLLELLPGNIAHNPDMGSTNSITLRETGNLGASGSKSANEDYNISSLGTAFIVDGAPINNDANLQGVPGATAGDPEYKRSAVNRGVDMRTISTDNIESVDIIRGIPSAEYGNLTSGLVNIRRIKRATPFTARFKADEYSKLFSASKGFGLRGHNHIINADAGYLDSKIDPRNSMENYKRINASVRANFHWTHPIADIRWNAGVDYTGSFDNAKTDPDLNYNKIDEYKSSYHRYAFTSEFSIAFSGIKWLNSIGFNSSLSYQTDKSERRKQVAPQRASVAPTSMDEGVHDARYLMREYISEFTNSSCPMALFLKARADGSRAIGSWLHEYKAGAEWTLTKNYGHGQQYDLTKPLTAAWTTRPRDFNTIPALQVLSFYAEDKMSILIGGNKPELQLGVRTIALPSLSGKYYLSGRTYIDPRINAVWNFPAITLGDRPLRFLIAGGYGVTTKMPTVDYLYPQLHYNDMIQLNYYDVNRPEELSRISVRTYIADATNHLLRPARNRKWEVRIGAEWGRNSVSVTYFREKMNDGFRYSYVYVPYEYRCYDALSINPSELSQAPDISTLPYTDKIILDGMRRVTNGSRIDKQGVEFQLSTARWKPVGTALTISGAWLHTVYSNSQMLYSPVTDVVGSQPVSDLYVGIYDTTDGRVNDQINTNFTLDTQIPRWGLVFSTSVQCMWHVKTARLRENGVPASYISAIDRQIHPYTETSRNDIMLQYLVKTYNEASYNTTTIPAAIYVNLKATKKIGRRLKLSAFANRILDYLPDYDSNGITIRRYADAYFGMEATITL